MSGTLTAVFDVAEPERTTRLRELRMAALLLLGSHHPLTRALAAPIGEPRVLDAALVELDSLAAIPKRRLLATIASVLPA